jgi:gliding motility-associated-like protein
MRQKIIYIIMLFSVILCPLDSYCAEPTTQATNVKITVIECNEFRVNWTNGNGNGRLVIVKEGSAVDATPVDAIDYSQSSNYGSGDEIGTGTGNFVVYNTVGSYITVTGLTQGLTYHVAVFEYNDIGAPKDYLLTNPARANAATLDLNVDFNFNYTDSCANNNLFNFNNITTSTISGLAYSWKFGDGKTSSTKSPSHSYNDPLNYQFNVTLEASPNYGCVPYKVTKRVEIVPFPILLPQVTDTVQCIRGNDFDFLGDVTFTYPPSQFAFNYFWKFDDGTNSTARKYNKTYNTSDTFHVSLRINMIKNNVTTNCFDTGYIDVVVLPEPSSSMNLSDTIMCLAGNVFNFSNTDPSVTDFKWHFGDGDSSDFPNVNHSYKDTGTYSLIHRALATSGCSSADTTDIIVRENKNAWFTGLDTMYCKTKDVVTLVPVDPIGVFSGPGIAGDTFVPNFVGYHSIKHIISDTICPDTIEKFVRVRDIPFVELPNDTILCDQLGYNLNSSSVGTHNWSTGETTNNIIVGSTDHYWLEVSDGHCTNSDTTYIFFETTPTVNLGNDTTVCKTSLFVLRATNSNASYMWNNGSDDSTIAITKDGYYSVNVKNLCGEASDDVYINFEDEHCNLFIPTAFSPNNDGVNDYFFPQGDKIIVESFHIYNRWGELVFTGSEQNPMWDGTIGGAEPLANSTYLWVVVYVVREGDITVRGVAKGDVILLR